MNPENPPEIMVAGLAAATLSPDGQFLVLDLADLLDPTKTAARLAIPAEGLETLTNQLHQVKLAVMDPASGIRWTPVQ